MIIIKKIYNVAINILGSFITTEINKNCGNN